LWAAPALVLQWIAIAAVKLQRRGGYYVTSTFRETHVG
jgi:hypothetical protein